MSKFLVSKIELAYQCL